MYRNCTASDVSVRSDFVSFLHFSPRPRRKGTICVHGRRTSGQHSLPYLSTLVWLSVVLLYHHTILSRRSLLFVPTSCSCLSVRHELCINDSGRLPSSISCVGYRHWPILPPSFVTGYVHAYVFPVSMYSNSVVRSNENWTFSSSDDQMSAKNPFIH